MNATVERGLAAGCVLALLLLAGCATNRIDWQARVGSYTYDQAVMELGPPAASERLADGTRVAEWLTRRSQSYLYPTFGYAPYWYGPVYPMYSQYSSPDYYLRLIFGPDGRLQSWKRLTK